MTSYNTFLKLWYAWQRAEDENDIETSNGLIIAIENLLPFASEQEHEHWLDESATYLGNEFGFLTFEIAERLRTLTFAQEQAVISLIEDYNKLGQELDPFCYEEINTIISVWEQFKENYTEACKNIREEIETIKSENEDCDIIIELSNEILEQLDYMEEL